MQEGDLVKVDLGKCIGCSLCSQTCPVGAITVINKKAVIGENCVECKACSRVCPKNALIPETSDIPDTIQCDSCPIKCRIKLGNTGACFRYTNRGGKLVRNVTLNFLSDVKDIIGKEPDPYIRKPLVTAIGAGTTYPDYRPAPHIVKHSVGGIEVITAVTEAPLSYSGIKLKIDTEINLGEETAPVLFNKRIVGHLCTEEYGAKILSIGGVNQLTGQDGFTVARCITNLANKQSVNLKVKGGANLEIQVGQPPVINGEESKKMRIGCGSATAGLLAPYIKNAADEVIVLDSHITSLFTEHEAGRFLGVKPSGIHLKFRRSTPGRYFGEHGNGWGGTPIKDPRDVIESIDMDLAHVGMTVLITETNGERAAMFWVTDKGQLEKVTLSNEAQEFIEQIQSNCEPSRVSGIYIGGAGGSLRAGVAKYPIRLTHAIHSNKAVLTVGGASTYILPGGNIVFMVDVEKVKLNAFSWVPTPAVVVPIEITMKAEDYLQMGGHIQQIKSLEELKRYVKQWS